MFEKKCCCPIIFEKKTVTGGSGCDTWVFNHIQLTPGIGCEGKFQVIADNWYELFPCW